MPDGEKQTAVRHGWHSDAQALAVAMEANDLAREEILHLRTLLNGWLLSGAMVGADLDKLRTDTEEALKDE